MTIYKTPDAGLIGQGLSGTLDMQTARPLNFSDTVVAVSTRYQESSLGSAANIGDDGSRFNASYIDQFADGRRVSLAVDSTSLSKPGRPVLALAGVAKWRPACPMEHIPTGSRRFGEPASSIVTG